MKVAGSNSILSNTSPKFPLSRGLAEARYSSKPVDSGLNLSCLALSRTTLTSPSGKPHGASAAIFQREPHLRSLSALKLHHDGVQDRIERLHRITGTPIAPS